MTRPGLMITAGIALLTGLALGTAIAQQGAPAPAAAPVPYFVGNRLGMPITPGADGVFNAMSSNVKVYGSVYSAESCSYDPVRRVIVVPNRGVAQNVQTNNAWITFLNHDGSVHTSRWVGVQNPGDQRNNMTPPLVLNEPLGSDVANGVLYLADRDGGTGPNDPAVSVIRRFNMQTGLPSPAIRVEKSTGFNDIEVADDGTIYGTQTGAGGQNPDATTWQVWKITPDGNASIFIQGSAAAAAQRHRLRSARQHRRRQHRERGCDHVLAGRQTAAHGEGCATGQRRAGRDARWHEVRQQRRAGRRVPHPARSACRADRAEHSEPRVDVLRPGRESARDSDERQQRARVHPTAISRLGARSEPRQEPWRGPSRRKS